MSQTDKQNPENLGENDFSSDSSQLIVKIIDEIKHDLSDDEIVHFLLNQKQQINRINDKETFGEKSADAVASFVGSWNFIGCFVFVLVVWIGINTLLLTKPVDPYPFILLNLMLSMVAAIQAPLVMMSQNRQEKKDRERSENDYRVNLKTEVIIEDLHQRMIELSKIQDQLSEMHMNLLKKNPH